MRVAIRADASPGLGFGHVMRCLSLADALREDRAEVTFLCRDLPGVADLIAGQGHAVCPLPDTDPWDAERDAEHCLDRLETDVDWLVVDHYRLAADWERRLRTRCRRLLAIDDLADRDHECDLLLDQNLHAEVHAGYARRVPATCRCLLGPRYALLRRQFADARARLRRRDGPVARLLVFFGGGEVAAMTLRALSAIALLNRPDLAVDVVIGQTCGQRPTIEAACRALPDCRLHVQVEAMATLMAAADLALGAGGSATWERCCLGLPSLVVALADNQRSSSQAGAAQGVLAYLGDAETLSAERLAAALAQTLAHPQGLAGMAEAAMRLTDGQGGRYVLNAMKEWA
jgi:UDP-2,4-diacetamido-2,4,6-trideoxy-beta-L-altropyranose hydrolase